MTTLSFRALGISKILDLCGEFLTIPSLKFQDVIPSVKSLSANPLF